MADSLGYYFHRRGLWALGEQWHERAIDLRQTSSHAKDETALSHELYRRGVILAGRGTPHAAVECLRERLRLDEKAGDRQGQSASLHQMAIIESSQGNPTEARRLWEESVAIEEDLGSPGGKASTLVMLAQLEASEGNFAKAVEMVREALSLLESVGSGEVPMVRQILQAIEAAARGEVVGGGGPVRPGCTAKPWRRSRRPIPRRRCRCSSRRWLPLAPKRTRTTWGCACLRWRRR